MLFVEHTHLQSEVENMRSQNAQEASREGGAVGVSSAPRYVDYKTGLPTRYAHDTQATRAQMQNEMYDSWQPFNCGQVNPPLQHEYSDYYVNHSWEYLQSGESG